VTFLANRNINRLAVHSALHQLAWWASGVFLTVFLLRAGLAPAAIFLSLAAIRALRFVLRPLVLLVLPVAGLRRTLMLSTLLFAIQYPVLAVVDGLGPALLAYCVLAALGEAFYFTCYHAVFAALGDAEHRGSQLGVLQGLTAIAGVLGPAVGGLALAVLGPWAAFGVAALIEAAAAVPLRNAAEVPVERASLRDVLASAQSGVLLFFTDGWIQNCTTIAWDILMFRALGGRFDAFGGALAAAAVFGALGGLVLGRFIDLSRARYVAWINAAVTAAIVLFKAGCGSDAASVVLVASLTAMLSALYVPALMTALYNDAKRAPCPLRFQFAAEACWDIGGALACLAAAALCLAGGSLQTVILLALPAVAVQAALLNGRYHAHSFPQVEFGR
jgi:DHA1 family inner membrane transport protein